MDKDLGRVTQYAPINMFRAILPVQCGVILPLKTFTMCSCKLSSNSSLTFSLKMVPVLLIHLFHFGFYISIVEPIPTINVNNGSTAPPLPLDAIFGSNNIAQKVQCRNNFLC
jgi:hypothetical protein